MYFFSCILLVSMLFSCTPGASGGSDLSNAAEAAALSGAGVTVGLILTASDADENDSVISVFENLSDSLGFELEIYVPDVTSDEAAAALEMESGTFNSCDVNPIEYQMLGVNEMVAADADIIVIHPNHTEALTGVLSAARSAGILVCAWDVGLSGGSCDFYAADAEGAVSCVAEIINSLSEE